MIVASIFGMVLFFVLHGNASAQTSLQQLPVSLKGNISTLKAQAIKPCGDCQRPPTNPGIFLEKGGKSVIEVKADHQEISLVRGSTGRITLTLSHIPGKNPLSSVSIVDAKINNGYIPAYLAKLTTPEQRVQAIQSGKPIPGAIDLNSLVRFTPKQITIKPNESKQIFMDVTIPKDWDDRMVGEHLWFSIAVIQGQGYDYHDLLIKQTAVSVHITG
jgi:hypothetical protein